MTLQIFSAVLLFIGAVSFVVGAGINLWLVIQCVRILQGDCMEVLRTLPDESVNCVVSSPPYWRQRNYGMAGQLGLEPTPELYIDRLVAIFSECRRVLKADGTCWVNLGDKWASGGNGGGGSFMEQRGDAWAHASGSKGWRSPPQGYKDKDLVQMVRARGMEVIHREE